MSDRHLDDLLSALLDGELDATEAASARAHLDACPGCRGELAATAETRDLVRGLPAVEPPFGFYERLLLKRRSGRAVAALAGAAAAAIMLVAVGDPTTDPVQPAVADLVDRHAATASAGGDPVTQFVPVGVPVRFDR